LETDRRRASRYNLGGKPKRYEWGHDRRSLLCSATGGRVTKTVPTDPILVHATAIAIDGRAVLLRGPSGAGKSDLALRLIDCGARLVGDDQAELRQIGRA